MGRVSSSPPFKRTSRILKPESKDACGSRDASIVPSTPAATLESLIREAHSQYHDRLRELRRDCELMARHFLKQRDDKISFYTRNLGDKSSVSVQQLTVTDAPDSTDFSLDLVEHA